MTGGVLPPSWVMSVDPELNVVIFTWSNHGRLLPFLDGTPLADSANFDLRPESYENSTTVSRPIGKFLCPSDPNGLDGAYEIFGGRVWGSNYVWNVGDWYIFPGYGVEAIRTRPRAPFYLNSSVRLRDIADGLGKTMFASEAKINQPFSTCQYRVWFNADAVPGPDAKPDDVAPYNGWCPPTVDPDLPPGAPPVPELGRAEWFDGRLLHTGFTTAWTPNKTTVRFIQGKPVDIDMGGYPDWEPFRGPTFGAFTARSYHGDGVHVLMGDGSVHYVGNSIDGAVWRAAGTVASGETVTAF